MIGIQNEVELLNVTSERRFELMSDVNPRNVMIVDPLSEQLSDNIPNVLSLQVESVDGLKSLRIVEHIPAGTFHGGAINFSEITDQTFYGGSVLEQSESQSTDSQAQFIEKVLAEIFNGDHDLGDIDTMSLNDTSGGMPATLQRLFINSPGSGGGRSTLRHIFMGDRRGGKHVVRGELSTNDLISSGQSLPDDPFIAAVKINGLLKVRKTIDSQGQSLLVPQETTMFPVSYDSMSILQTIIDSWQNRGHAERTTDSIETPLKVYHGIPVEHYRTGILPMKLVTGTGLDGHERIITAHPDISVN